MSMSICSYIFFHDWQVYLASTGLLRVFINSITLLHLNVAVIVPSLPRFHQFKCFTVSFIEYLPAAPWLSHFSWWNDVKCVTLYRFPKLLLIWRPSVCKMPTKTPCSLGYPPVITHSGLQSHVSFSEVRWGNSVFVCFYPCLDFQKPPFHLSI